MINLKIIRDAGFAGKAAPADAGPAGPSRGKGKGGGVGGGKKGSIDPASALLTNLESWWKLDETGTITTWADATANANDLTNSGGTSTATAKQGTAADFSAVGVFGYRDPAGTGLATTTEDFSLCAWLYTTGSPGTNTWASVMYRGLSNSSSSSTRDFTIGRYSTGANNFYAGIYTGSTSGNAQSTATDAIGQWFFIAAYYDYSADAVAISVNGETLVVNSALPGKINTNHSRFHIGRGPSSGIANNWYVKGYVDEAAFWNNRVLTQDEINWLYNSGDGRAYSELT